MSGPVHHFPVPPRRSWLAALLAALAASSCTPAPPGEDPAAGSTSPADIAAADVAAGRDLFRRHGCPLCHGPEGHGDGALAATLDPPPRDFRDATAYRVGASEEQIAKTIEEGLMVLQGSGMPPYPHIPPEDRQRIARFIVSMQGEE